MSKKKTQNDRTKEERGKNMINNEKKKYFRFFSIFRNGKTDSNGKRFEWFFSIIYRSNKLHLMNTSFVADLSGC